MTLPAPIVIGKPHARRLREIYRSAGWPCQDLIEIELLAAGLVERVRAASGHETLRVTDAGIQMLSATLQGNRAARSDHEVLVQQVARDMVRAGRVVWTGLSLRAQVPGPTAQDAPQWCIAMPDVFSIRNTTVEAYVEPVVHEIKVRRADLLGDLKKAAKRAAYLDLGGACWYVLGNDAQGPRHRRARRDPRRVRRDDDAGREARVARPAPRRPVERLPFAIWLELAKRTPHAVEGGDQAPLADLRDESMTSTMAPEAPRIPPEDGIASLVAAAPGYTIAVRALCEFTAKRGDLDLRFTPSPTGAEGIEGHAVVTARRAAGYQTEVPLAGDFGPLRVRGRADGWDPAARRLEEIKTYPRRPGPRAGQPPPAALGAGADLRRADLPPAWAGAGGAGAGVLQHRHATGNGLLPRAGAANALQAFFEDQCQRFAAWSAQEAAHRAARDAALAPCNSRCRRFAPVSAKWPRRCTAAPARAAA